MRRRPSQSQYVSNAGWAISSSLKQLISQIAPIVGVSQSKLVTSLLRDQLGWRGDEEVDRILSLVRRIQLPTSTRDSNKVKNSGWGIGLELRTRVAALAQRYGVSASWLVELTLRKALGLSQEVLPWVEVTVGR